MEFAQLGKFIVIAGVVLIILGAVIMLAGRLPFVGQLPGDIEYRRGNTTIYFPLASMIIISIILTVILNIILRR